MNKLLTFIISLLLIGCCGETELPESGLKGEVKMLTEYNVRIINDSINNPIRDTLSVVKRYYNERNQIIERNQVYTFTDETMDIIYEYNRCNRLEKEQVKMSFDSSAVDVDYIYKGSLLNKTISESSRDSITFEQIGLYKYNSDKKLIENSVAQLFIDLKTGDTIKNSLQIDKYNQNEVVMESEIKYQEKPSENGRTEYFYKSEDLIKTLEYNQNDSLIATYRFEYKKDQIGNWIERSTYKNDKLNNIKIWNIVYK
jgi:hypothetical protein|tara:strand:+ start:67 stop:834 length:768 start_codon:yes stop_codon:yes gene_type:complete